MRGKLKSAPKVPNFPDFIWEGGGRDTFGTMNGYPAAATRQVAGDLVIFGNFADVIIAGWAGLDVVVDPYSQATQGTVRITVNQFMDVGLRHAASFCVSSDAGNQ